MRRQVKRRREKALGLPSNAAITREHPDHSINLRLYANRPDWTLADGMEQLSEAVCTNLDVTSVSIQAELLRESPRGALLHVTSIKQRI